MLMAGRNLSWVPLVLVLLLLASGCGKSNRGSVAGKVTLDGEPVEAGMISFIPSGAESEAAWTEIKAGSYSISAQKGVAVGSNRVEVRWARKTGKKFPAVPPAPPDAMIEETVEAIPPRYNTQSELKADVKAGNNTFDFKLNSR